MQRQPTTVIFDWARVIRHVSWGYASKALAPLLGEDDKARLKAAFFPQLTELERGAVEPSVFWPALSERLGLEPSPEIVAAIRNGYLQVVGKPIDETITLLAELREHPQIQVAIFSNSVPGLRDIVETSEERALVDEAFYSCDLGTRKPDRSAFERVLNDLGAVPNETIFVDDQKKNVEAASAMGMVAVHFDGPQALAEVRRHLGMNNPPPSG